jgi:SAM-dependent methyltransferase
VTPGPPDGERVHEMAQAFGGAAGAYERGRPSYPAVAIGFLVEQLDLRPGRTVVDLAAGTGKLTRLLVPTGATVIAVEPVDGMRAELVQRVRGVEALDGTAEAMPLPDGSADAVTAAQAFHWFDGQRALPEIHRVLRPGGALAVVYNRRLSGDALTAAIGEIPDRYRGSAPEHTTDRWRDAFRSTDLFTAQELTEFPSTQDVDEQGLVDRVLSTSVVAALPADELGAVEDEVRALAARQPRPMRLHYNTEVFVCRRR